MRKGPVKTYGRHRNRVIAPDVWLSDGDKQRNVFSTSSEFDSSKHSNLFQSSDFSAESLNSSENNTDIPVFKARGNGNSKTNRRKKPDEKENKQSRLINKRTTRLASDKDQSSCSAGSDSSSYVSRPTSRKALQDRNNQVDHVINQKKKPVNQTGKRKRPEKKVHVQKDESFANFSDFENYSLVISDSSLNQLNSKEKHVFKDAVETSTPVAKRTRHKDCPVLKLRNPNVSGILTVESPGSSISCSPAESSHSVRGRGSFSSLVSSPSILSSTSSKSVDLSVSNDQKLLTPENAVVKIQRLTDSFLSMHVSTTRGTNTGTFDKSRSLFSSDSGSVCSPVENSNPISQIKDSVRNSKFGAKNRIFDKSNSLFLSYSSNTCSPIENSKGKSISRIKGSIRNYSVDVSSEIIEDTESSGTEEEEEEEEENECEEETDEEDESLSVLLEEDEEESEEDEEEEGEDLDSQSSSSNTTLYMLNEDRRSYETDRLSSSDVAEMSEISVHADTSDRLSVSDYKTANSCQSFDDVCYCSASSGRNDGIEEEEVLQAPLRNCLHLKQLNSLQESFSEMLTPTRRKKSLVPVSAYSKILLACNQTQAISFEECLPSSVMQRCVKIGEGVYGEVFRSEKQGNSIALKIIPIEGDFPVNDEPQKRFEEMIPEVVIAKELSDLRHHAGSITHNFCQVNQVSLVQGEYPSHLLKQWDIFHKNRHSENDRPDMFSDQQLFIVFEFADCGKDLESFKLETMHQARSVLTQVCFALAVAEEALQFEHRDLHWGNVLVRPTKQEYITFSLTGRQFSVPSMGVEASIIDYTLSRLRKDGCTVYCDLSKDETLFQGKGDYQFDIYRKMREDNGDDWEKFTPHTNVCWLHYLTNKLVYSKDYTSQTSRQNREILRQFRQFHSEIMSYGSACELALDSLFLNS